MDLQRKWQAVLERLRFKHGPAMADAALSLSTLRARARLSRIGPLSILVDNAVLFHAVTHETAWVSTGTTKWGPNDVETGYAARIPVRRKDGTSREYSNVSFLAGIAHLARHGRLSLFTSGELDVERFKQPAGRFSGYGIFDYNLFAGIDMKRADGVPDMVFGPRWMNLPSLAEQQRERLERSSNPLYLALVKQLGPKNNQDAWHIHTAEKHGMFCFLTMDFKLCKIVEARQHQELIRSLRTKVMTPLQLGKYLRLFPVDPRFLSYTNASYPVRADLHWPDGERRRPPRRRPG